MACEIAGVGVYSVAVRRSSTSTPFAASTSSALANAGSESACVSMPRNSGPSIRLPARYSQIACVMARMCHSLKERSKDEPRWPEVPKLTCCARMAGIGPLREIGGDQLRNVDEHRGRIGGLSGRGMTVIRAIGSAQPDPSAPQLRDRAIDCSRISRTESLRLTDASGMMPRSRKRSAVRSSIQHSAHGVISASPSTL